MDDMAYKNVCLLSHAPSEATLEFVKQIPGEWVIYHYTFHVTELKDVVRGITGVLHSIHTDVDLERVSRILLAPPGMSIASPLMVEGIRGISGIKPELLMLIRNESGEYVPCPEAPILHTETVYASLRRRRSSGVVA